MTIAKVSGCGAADSKVGAQEFGIRAAIWGSVAIASLVLAIIDVTWILRPHGRPQRGTLLRGIAVVAIISTCYCSFWTLSSISGIDIAKAAAKAHEIDVAEAAEEMDEFVTDAAVWGTATSVSVAVAVSVLIWIVRRRRLTLEAINTRPI
jgi:hypothetical protein